MLPVSKPNQTLTKQQTKTKQHAPNNMLGNRWWWGKVQANIPGAEPGLEELDLGTLHKVYGFCTSASTIQIMWS